VEIFAHKQNQDLQIEVWNSNSVVEAPSEQLFLRGVGLRNSRARLEQLYGVRGQLLFRALARGGAGALICIPARQSISTPTEPSAEIAP